MNKALTCRIRDFFLRSYNDNSGVTVVGNIIYSL